jgi:hypothetical protein
MGFSPLSFFTDAGPATDIHSGTDWRANGTVTLRRGDTVIGRLPYRARKYFFTVPDEESTYRLRMSAARHVSYTNLSTRVTGVWTFRSGRPDSDTIQMRPLLAVRYSVPGLDDQNRAKARRRVAIPIEVLRSPHHQAVNAESLKVWASTDDGATWHSVTVRRRGTGWLAIVHNPPAGYVSLRATASDADGNRVTETIIHAYAVRR